MGGSTTLRQGWVRVQEQFDDSGPYEHYCELTTLHSCINSQDYSLQSAHDNLFLYIDTSRTSEADVTVIVSLAMVHKGNLPF